MLPGLNRRTDVEVSLLDEEHRDLTPVSTEGVRAMSDYLGYEVVAHVPVRVTNTQYEDFHDRIFHKQQYGELSLRMKPRFLGHKRSDASEFYDNPSPQLLEKYTHLRQALAREHDFTVTCLRYGSPPEDRLHKITRAQYAPSVSLKLSIGTADYYRDTTDQYEGSFSAPPTPGSTIRTPDGELIDLSTAAESLSLSISPCWIYCTTMIPSRGMCEDQYTWFKEDYDMATPIISPAEHFACRLGVRFGIWAKSRLRQVYRWLSSKSALTITNNEIRVVHGAVRYMDEPDRQHYLRELFREDRQFWEKEAIFTKTSDFAPEQEYRFAIYGWGQPQTDQIMLPLSRELIACYGPSVVIADLIYDPGSSTKPTM